MRLFLTIILVLPLFVFAQKNQTPEEVVKLIKENVTCDWQEQTVDVFKAGDPKSEIKGIAVCMFADMKTLERAVDLDCNFIITHEPVFYNHLDETETYSNNPVYLEKKKYINDHKLVIFRFHDHIHMTKPDGIYAGMLNKLDWKKYAVNEEGTHFEMPQTKVEDLVKELKEKLGLQSVRVIGDPQMTFTKLGLAVGAPGGQRHINALSLPDMEVMVAGEATEWETYLYANDAVEQNRKKAVVFVGHVKSEEAGMEYCTEWLKGFVKNVPIHFIENDLNFTTF